MNRQQIKTGMLAAALAITCLSVLRVNAASPPLVSAGQKITASHINAIRNSVISWEAAEDANGFNLTELGNVEINTTKYVSVGCGSGLSATRMRICRNSSDKVMVLGDTPYATGSTSTVGYGVDAATDGTLYHDSKVGDSTDEMRFRIGQSSEQGTARHWLRVLGSNGKVAFGDDIATAINVSGTGTVQFNGNTLRAFTVARTPASSSETCNIGELAFDSSFLYVCTAASTWKRLSLSSF